MANFDHFQLCSRPSLRLQAKRIKAEEEAEKNKSENQPDVEDVSKSPKRTLTPQLPRRRCNAPKQVSCRSKTKPTSNSRTTGVETTDHLGTVTRPATRRNAKRKSEADKHDVGEDATVPKRARVSDAPISNEAILPDADTLELHAQSMDDEKEDPANRTSSPLSTPPSSPDLDATALTLDLQRNDDYTETELYASVLDGAIHEASSQSSSGPVAERQPESILPTPPFNEPQIPSMHKNEVKPPVAYPGADTPNEVQDIQCLITTPGPFTNKISQLLTPPTTSRSSDSEEGTSSRIERPQRHRIQPELFGNLVSTASAIDTIEEEGAGLPKSSKDEYEESAASEIEVAMNSPVAPKPLRSQKKTSSASMKSKPSVRRKPKAAASVESVQTKCKVSKIGTKATRKSQEMSIKTSKITATRVSAGSRNPRKSSSAAPLRDSLVVTLPLPQPDAQQLALSQALTRREPLASKPEPQGQPEVWAHSRQALCETLPYFKKPQGGCYQNDGHVYGFLFDSVGHCREYMDEDVIICRAGGSMESDGDRGMVQRKDQTLQEAQVQAVLNDIAHHNPVIVICGNRNEKAPSKMPHVYCVLGWYKPIAVWSEKTAGKGNKVWTTVKYRLERLNHHRTAWHAPKSNLPDSQDERSVAGALMSKTCDHCHQEYPQIYLRSWICLNQRCDHFWKINGANAPLGSEGMEYNPAYLLHRSQPWGSDEQDEPEPSSLRPALPNFGNTIGDNLTYVNTRGICCPHCGRCSSRRLFSGWVCENPACDFRLPVKYQPIPPAMLYTPWDAAPTLLRNRRAANVQIAIQHKHGYKVSIYTFEGIDGRFIHAAATKAVVQEEGGADDMFQIMQSEDIGLERRTFAGKKMAGGRGEKGEILVEECLAVTDSNAVEGKDERAPPETVDVDMDEGPSSEKKPEFADGDLMTAFSMNYGMPYKFVASGASKSFEHAPEAVTEARCRLNWASRVFLQTSEEEDFNELLIFAYLQGQKVEYHDDGEEGLGPHIAALSLGGRAKMHMRMKMKHHVGCSKTGLLTEERPVPGGIAYDQRLQMWNELQSLKANDPAAYAKRRKEIPKEIGIFDKRNKKADDLVTVSLSHGDIVLMDGYDIQKYLEHKVVPEDHLRFALTCRTVLENHLKPEERPDYVVQRDERMYHGPRL